MASILSLEELCISTYLKYLEHECAAYVSLTQSESVILKIGFQLKGFSFSGEPPLETLSKDGKLINIAGALWDSQNDTMQFNIKELNFNAGQK